MVLTEELDQEDRGAGHEREPKRRTLERVTDAWGARREQSKKEGGRDEVQQRPGATHAPEQEPGDEPIDRPERDAEHRASLRLSAGPGEVCNHAPAGAASSRAGSLKL